MSCDPFCQGVYVVHGNYRYISQLYSHHHSSVTDCYYIAALTQAGLYLYALECPFGLWPGTPKRLATTHMS